MIKPKDDQKNLLECICEKCSVYSECNKSKAEKLFCARQKSSCDMDTKKMCICGMCSVYNQCKLEGGYFCRNGINN
jgi:hypothetical protein